MENNLNIELSLKREFLQHLFINDENINLNNVNLCEKFIIVYVDENTNASTYQICNNKIELEIYNNIIDKYIIAFGLNNNNII